MDFLIERDPASAFSDLLWQLMDLERYRALFSPLRVVSATAFVLWMEQQLSLNNLSLNPEAEAWATLETLVSEADWRQVLDYCSDSMVRKLTQGKDSVCPIALERVISTLAEETMLLGLESRRQLWRFASKCNSQQIWPSSHIEPRYADVGVWIARGIEEMISQCSRKFPQFMEMATPSPVIAFMAQLVALEETRGAVYDPCCGSGGLLLRCAQASGASVVRGTEINSAVGALAWARLALADKNPNLILGDALEPIRYELMALGRDFPGDLLCEADNKARCESAVMNPPWNHRVRDIAGFTGTLDLALMWDAIRRLRSGGRLIVCLPSGFFFTSGANQLFREALLQQLTIEAVIALPNRSFSPFTGVPANILVVRKEANVDYKPVRFADLRTLKPSEDYAHLAKGLMDGSSPLVWEQTVVELLENGCNLAPNRYVPTPWSALQEATADAGVKWTELGEIAELIRGTSPRQLGGADDPQSPTVPLVGMSDFDRATGEFKAATRSVSDREMTDNLEMRRLQTGDLLVTIDGTLGDCFAVDKILNRAFALPSMAIARARPDSTWALFPGYLGAILSSKAFKEWAQGQNVGSGVPHLQMQMLRKFQVPILSVEDQMQLVEWAIEGFDALESLQQLTGRGVIDVMTVWLGANENLLPANEAEARQPLADLQAASQSLKVLQNSNWLDGTGSRWLDRFVDSLRFLSGIETIPEALARWALLTEVLGIWRDLQNALDEDGRDLEQPIAAHSARTVLFRLSSLAKTARQQMLDQCHIEAIPLSSELVAGRENVCSVAVWNRSTLPLRSFEVKFRDVAALTDGNEDLYDLSAEVGADFHSTPGWTLDADAAPDIRKSTPYLSAEPVVLSCRLAPASNVTELNIVLNWRAIDFAGQPLGDSVSFSVIVRSPSDDSSGVQTDAVEHSLGPTPYLKGSSIPATNEGLLFGREKELRAALETLMSPFRAGIVIVEGNRRIGKTSLLGQIEQRCAERFLVVRCSLQTGNGTSQGGAVWKTVEFYRVLCVAVANTLNAEGVDASPPHSGDAKPIASKFAKFALASAISKALQEVSHPSQLWDFYLGLALDHVAQSATPRGVLLLMDEFDKLPQSIEAGTCEAMVPENLRAQLQEHSGFTMVIAGSQGLKRMRQTHLNPIFGLGKTVELDHLDASAAARLVTETPPSGTIAFAPDATKRIVELCDGRPYFLQGLCDALWNYGQRSVTLSLVEKVARDYASGEEALTDLWKEAGERRINEKEMVPHRRGLLLALAARHQGEGNAPAQGEPLRLETFERLLDESRVSVPSDGELFVGDDLDTLCQLKLLRLENGIYRFTLPLLATWIATQKDFEVLRSNAEKEGSQLI